MGWMRVTLLNSHESWRNVKHFLGGGFKYFLFKVLALAPFQLGALFILSARVGWPAMFHGVIRDLRQIGL